MKGEKNGRNLPSRFQDTRGEEDDPTSPWLPLWSNGKKWRSLGRRKWGLEEEGCGRERRKWKKNSKGGLFKALGSGVHVGTHVAHMGGRMAPSHAYVGCHVASMVACMAFSLDYVGIYAACMVGHMALSYAHASSNCSHVGRMTPFWVITYWNISKTLTHEIYIWGQVENMVGK